MLSGCFNAVVMASVFSVPPPPPVKVSHDFAVNFDEDNPECAGELSNKRLYSQPVRSIHPSIHPQHPELLRHGAAQASHHISSSLPTAHTHRTHTHTQMHRSAAVQQEEFPLLRDKRHQSVSVKGASTHLHTHTLLAPHIDAPRWGRRAHHACTDAV